MAATAKAYYLPILFLLFSSFILSFPVVVFSAMFTFENQCGYTVWPGILTNSNAATAELSTTGFVLNSGSSFNVSIPAPWSGRVWARTRCSHNSTTRNFTCLTGDCGSGTVECPAGGAAPAPPVTLAEFTLHSADGLDLYNVSLVDGYNLPMLVAPQGGGGNCAITGCVADLNTACPSELKVVSTVDIGGDTGGDIGGDVGGDGDIGERFLACRSACEAFGDPKYCCSSEYDACKPSPYSELFKNVCPLAYSYAGDNSTISFTCAAPDYVITICAARSISQNSSGTGGGPLVPNGGDMTLKPVHLSCTLIIFFAVMLMLWRIY